VTDEQHDRLIALERDVTHLLAEVRLQRKNLQQLLGWFLAWLSGALLIVLGAAAWVVEQRFTLRP